MKIFVDQNEKDNEKKMREIESEYLLETNDYSKQMQNQ